MGKNLSTYEIEYSEGVGVSETCNNVSSTWNAFKAKIAAFGDMRTAIPQSTYLAMDTTTQRAHKSTNGWFSGAPFLDGKRVRMNVLPRKMLTFDLDACTPALFEKIKNNEIEVLQDVQYVYHTSRKHSSKKPRVRIIILSLREVSPDEYPPLMRLLAQKISKDMSVFDRVSFVASQMMFYPTLGSDTEWEYGAGLPGAEPLDPDSILKGFDFSKEAWASLPQLPDELEVRESQMKAQNPLGKTGAIGDFCTVYDIHTVIETFLPDAYISADTGGAKDRYTYTGSTTVGGAIVQDDGVFLYSHHSTDPVSHQLVNSFDLVRVHKFGHLDEAKHQALSIDKRPSYKAMLSFVDEDEGVIEHRHQKYADAFEDIEDNDSDEPETNSDDESVPKKKKGRKSPHEICMNYMNKKYAMVLHGKNVGFLRKTAIEKRTEIIPLMAIRPLEAHVPSPAPKDHPNIVDYFVAQPETPKYENGFYFDPTGTAHPNAINLWDGWAVEPDPDASCELFKKHCLEILCKGNHEYYEYLMDWLAHMVQNPGEKPEVAVIIRGRKRTGKDTFGEYVKRLVGARHYFLAEKRGQIYGRFNEHLIHALFINMTEAFWAGDKEAESNLKSLITSNTLTLEAKHGSIYDARNYSRFLMTSNEDWVVPNTADETRYFVLDICESMASNVPYFRALYAEMNGKGPAALLHHLQNRDLSERQIRMPPKTEGAIEQQRLSLTNENLWWFECLTLGCMEQSAAQLRRVDLPSIDLTVPTRASFRDIEGHYHLWYDSHAKQRGQKLSAHRLGLFLNEVCGEAVLYRDNGIVRKGRQLDGLPALRSRFEDVMRAKLDWGDDDSPPIERDIADDFPTYNENEDLI